MTKINRELKEAFDEKMDKIVEGYDLSKFSEKIKSVMLDVEEDFRYSIKEELAIDLSDFVRKMAEDAITSLLKGDENMFKSYLSCQKNQYNGRKIERPVGYNGHIFESDPLALRKKIVNDYADILKTERILDLEAQLEAVVKQLTETRNSFENYIRNN